MVDPAAGVFRPAGRCFVRLETACRAAIVDSRPRGESADAAEQDLRSDLREQPVAHEKGQWRLYQWGSDHPVLIGTRALWGSRDRRLPRTSLDETVYRVVLWGYSGRSRPVQAAGRLDLVLVSGRGAAGTERQLADEVPLPPGGHRLVAIRAVDSGAITAFPRTTAMRQKVLRALVRRARLDGC